MLFFFKPQFNNNKEEHGNQRGPRPGEAVHRGSYKGKDLSFLVRVLFEGMGGGVDSGGPYQDPRGGLLSFPELLA